MSHETELLTEIRDLLQVMAEPMLAQRDKKFRTGIRKVVGKSEKGRKALVLMDGTRTQSNIVKEIGIDPGNLNRLVKSLQKEGLCNEDGKHPKLLGRLPHGFFEQSGDEDE